MPLKGYKEKPRKFLIFNENGRLAAGGERLDSELIVGEDKLIEAMEEIAGLDEDDMIADFTIFEVTEIEFTARKEVTVILNRGQ